MNSKVHWSTYTFVTKKATEILKIQLKFLETYAELHCVLNASVTVIQSG